MLDLDACWGALADLLPDGPPAPVGAEHLAAKPPPPAAGGAFNRAQSALVTNSEGGERR
jgi:hypothetical protein